MKMIYQTRHTNNDYKKILFKFFLVLVFLVGFGLITPLRSLVLDSLSPFFQSGDYLNKIFVQIPKSLIGQDDLMKENERLLIELEQMRVDLTDFEMIKIENKDLSKQLQLSSDFNLLGSKIIGRFPQIALDTLLVDRGSRDGIEEGDQILVGERVFIGKVVKVSASNSIVALNSLPGTISYGFVDRTGELLEVSGVGGGSMKAEVPNDFDIQLNDRIIKEGSKDLVLAIVGLVEEDSTSSFKKVLLSLPANIGKTRIIFIQ